MKSGDEVEIVTRLRTDTVQTLKEELADVFSWLCAFLYKIGDIMREVRSEQGWYKFADLLGKKYFRGDSFVCFACGMNPCDDDCRAVWFVQRAFRDIAKERRLTL